MRIFLGHNFYRSSAPSGEDAVYRNERSLLEERNDVLVYERFNDDIDESTLAKRLKLGLEGAWSQQAYQELKSQIKAFRPDVAHFHNTFPLISPSAYAACQDSGVPVVQTLHNYRFVCPNALLLRDEKPCEDCLGTSLLPALRHRCYRGSLPATGAQVWTLVRNRWRGTYKRFVNRYIALTEFAASRLVRGGLPIEKMVVKPNFLPDPPSMGSGEGHYVVFAGRLSNEKGVQTLLKAWVELAHIPLKILGDGPLRSQLEEFAHSRNLNVEFLGFRGRDEILRIVREASLQVVPSEWYEGFPMVVLEAYACGTPVLASAIGSLDEIVVEGVTGAKFTPGNASALANAVSGLWADPVHMANLRTSTRNRFDELYTAEMNLVHLEKIYLGAIEDFRNRSKVR